MSDVVIRVENLSKQYVIGRPRGASSGEGLRHALQDAVTAPFRKLRPSSILPPSSQGTSTDFYALRDVSFEVNRGEVLGIIGRNGAGKSTLLKILSRITEPTSGRIGIKGRVASLLEVGTGFHPELTGRENIYLNGAILGMTRSEVKSKFDEIVDFSGVEKFLDTPVKRYSSGMYVRLAFAVAAHLEPEILIVDEVLAVGDAEFQKKCLGKMKDVSQTLGRTVLLVSHNLEAIAAMCNNSALLEVGRLSSFGPTGSVLRKYRESSQRIPAFTAQSRRPGTGTIRIARITAEKAEFEAFEQLSFRVQIEKMKDEAPCYLSLDIFDGSAHQVLHLSTEGRGDGLLLPEGQAIHLQLIEPSLKPGCYTVNGTLWGSGIIDSYVDACEFVVTETFAKSGYTFAHSKCKGAFLPQFTLNIASSGELKPA